MVKHTTGQWETRARKLSNTYVLIAKTHQREDECVLAIDDQIVCDNFRARVGVFYALTLKAPN